MPDGNDLSQVQRELGKIEGQIFALTSGQASLSQNMAELRASTERSFERFDKKLDSTTHDLGEQLDKAMKTIEEANKVIYAARGGMRVAIMAVGAVGFALGLAVHIWFH